MRRRLAALVGFFGTLVAGGSAPYSGSQDWPPHEFAYGAVLRNSSDLAARVRDFLSLPLLDASQTRIEVMSSSQGDIGLDGLRRTVESLSRTRPELTSLATDLGGVSKRADSVQQAVSLVSALIAFQDHLRNESRQDELIVFLHFAMKRPAEVEGQRRTALTALVSRWDTPQQSQIFQSPRAPSAYFEGNINIYPFAMDNAMWRRSTSFEPTESHGPILEIRFMGLRGLARYLFAEFEQRTSLRLVHLDGETI